MKVNYFFNGKSGLSNQWFHSMTMEGCNNNVKKNIDKSSDIVKLLQLTDRQKQLIETLKRTLKEMCEEDITTLYSYEDDDYTFLNTKDVNINILDYSGQIKHDYTLASEDDLEKIYVNNKNRLHIDNIYLGCSDIRFTYKLK